MVCERFLNKTAVKKKIELTPPPKVWGKYGQSVNFYSYFLEFRLFFFFFKISLSNVQLLLQ